MYTKHHGVPAHRFWLLSGDPMGSSADQRKGACNRPADEYVAVAPSGSSLLEGGGPMGRCSLNGTCPRGGHSRSSSAR